MWINTNLIQSIGTFQHSECDSHCATTATCLTSDPSAALWACNTSDIFFTYQGICDSPREGTNIPAADKTYYRIQVLYISHFYYNIFE